MKNEEDTVAVGHLHYEVCSRIKNFGGNLLT